MHVELLLQSHNGIGGLAESRPEKMSTMHWKTTWENQDCQWVEMQNINNFINMQRLARLEEPYSFAMVA
jgi:hypothetical protein